MKVKFFDIARKASLKSTHPLHHLGAVIVHNNKIISVGWNKYKTNPMSPHPYKQIHAEVDALFKANGSVEGMDIYVYREGKDGIPRISRPCKHCFNLLQKRGIRYVFYTDISFKGEAVCGKSSQHSTLGAM